MSMVFTRVLEPWDFIEFDSQMPVNQMPPWANPAYVAMTTVPPDMRWARALGCSRCDVQWSAREGDICWCCGISSRLYVGET